MSLFRAQLERDLADTFHNGREFGEILAFQIDGKSYQGNVVLEDSLKNRKKPEADHITSLDVSHLTAYIPLVLLGKVPRKGCEVFVQEKFYTIVSVTEELGEVVLSLEGVTE